MKKLSLIMMLSASTACSEHIPISITYACQRCGEDGPTPGVRDKHLDDLEVIFGLSFEQVNWSRRQSGYGWLNLEIVETRDAAVGSANIVSQCQRYARSIDNIFVVAHEVGHLLGLDHVNDKGNLMYPKESNSAYLSDKQLDDARDNAELFILCL